MHGLISWVDIYFMLTRSQQSQLNKALNKYSLLSPILHKLPMEEFKKITKNQNAIDLMVQLKRQHFKLLKVG